MVSISLLLIDRRDKMVSGEFLRNLAMESLENKFEYEFGRLQNVFNSPSFDFRKLTSYNIGDISNSIRNIRKLISDFEDIEYSPSKLEYIIERFEFVKCKFKIVCDRFIDHLECEERLVTTILGELEDVYGKS